jgi:hypothetical protein
MAKEQIGISGEFWFFSQLQRLGYEAYITLGNTKAIDLSVKLNTLHLLTFEVKSKMNFTGSFWNINITPNQNHFVVFIDLHIDKQKIGITKLLEHPTCYIVNSTNLSDIAFNWVSSQKASGYGFEAKLLRLLKFQDKKSITTKNITDFCNRHNIKGSINFKHYDNIIMTLEEFENKYYKLK